MAVRRRQIRRPGQLLGRRRSVEEQAEQGTDNGIAHANQHRNAGALTQRWAAKRQAQFIVGHIEILDTDHW
jgi:hypothetical protein